MRLFWVLVASGIVSGCSAKSFPDAFLFGASIAGFQVDMGCPTVSPERCEDRRSDWYQIITNGRELNPTVASHFTLDPPSSGPGHWELFEEDFARAHKDLGLNAVRLSIEWSRIFPNPTDGFEGVALRAQADTNALTTYHAMFASLKAKGMTPLVTLNHYTLPVWIHDGVACHRNLATCENRGWLDAARIQREISKYAGFVASEFGAEVDLWATLNEPLAVVIPGYLQPGKDRVNPPALSLRFEEARKVTLAMIDAHARMYDAIRSSDVTDADGNGKAAEIGIVYPIAPAYPKNPENPADRRGAQNLFYLNNTLFLDGVLKGTLDADADGTPDGPPRDDLSNRCDWLGINYYTRVQVTGTPTASFPQFSPLSTFDPFELGLWDDTPDGISEAISWARSRYQKPMFITETGADASQDPERPANWLVRSLSLTQKAVVDGADIRGFFVWTLMDNYEWNHGMSLRFGLYEVANTPTKERTPRSAVRAYRRIIASKDIPRDLRLTYSAPTP
jgi:beta-galactosidase